MQIIDKLKKIYFSIKHKRRKKQDRYQDDIYLLELKNAIYGINKEIPLGTSLWEEYRKLVRKSILDKEISDFINWEVIQKTMFCEAKAIEYKDIKTNNELFKAINESKVGNPKPYYLNSSTSGNLVHHAYSLNQFLKKYSLVDINTVIEIGGGYGSMCRLFRNLNYQNEYIIFDLPEFLALQKYFLNSINPEFIQQTIFIQDTKKLATYQKVFFIATWSFSEMPLNLRSELLSYIDFDYCLIAFQSTFDGINNIEYFNSFQNKYKDFHFTIVPISHLKNNFYLIGAKYSN